MIDPVGAAKAIKKELQSKYPDRKFRAKSERFSMGNSVLVVCDEEIIEEVRDIISKYQYGRFDSMTDSSSSVHNDNLPQSKFVSATAWSK